MLSGGVSKREAGAPSGREWLFHLRYKSDTGEGVTCVKADSPFSVGVIQGIGVADKEGGSEEKEEGGGVRFHGSRDEVTGDGEVAVKPDKEDVGVDKAPIAGLWSLKPEAGLERFTRGKEEEGGIKAE